MEIAACKFCFVADLTQSHAAYKVIKWACHGMRWGRHGSGKQTAGGRAYRLVGSPCVAGRPARSCPSAGPRDCTLLLGSLKDQEENLIVVKTWTWKRVGRGKKKRKHTRQSAIVPASAQTYCKTLCSCLWTTLTSVRHANMHTVGPSACKQSHCSRSKRGKHAVWRVDRRYRRGQDFTYSSSALNRPELILKMIKMYAYQGQSAQSSIRYARLQLILSIISTNWIMLFRDWEKQCILGL